MCVYEQADVELFNVLHDGVEGDIPFLPCKEKCVFCHGFISEMKKKYGKGFIKKGDPIPMAKDASI